MAPDAEEPQPERRFCALGSHRLRTPCRTIGNETLRSFAKLLNENIDHESLVCKECYGHLFDLYMRKVNNAKRHLAKKMADSVSDVSSSQPADSSSDPSAIMPVPQGRLLLSSNLSSIADVSSTSGRYDHNSSHSSDGRPTTSAAAAKKRRRSGERDDNLAPPPQRPRSSPSTSSDDYDPNSNLSLNAVNGTRLPHIQPIPRRRPTLHLNKESMDIYLAGTTGG
ncbi:uncharacterized protein HipHop [Drosophila takahashii]|uniref:uncharacterized protein HipHop n=1 Tax=Drosophila takahashii TaxID=29030 RepID=UPI001CF8DCE1|nr:uncharacterized protein LOC108056298 [Drosophila takahashii]